MPRLWRDHRRRRGLKNDRLFALRASGKRAALAAAALRQNFHAQIGLPGIGSLFGSLIYSLIAITAVTATARACRLLAAARLAGAISAAGHDLL
jgi:carbon starvation protein CstA